MGFIQNSSSPERPSENWCKVSKEFLTFTRIPFWNISFPNGLRSDQILKVQVPESSFFSASFDMHNRAKATAAGFKLIIAIKTKVFYISVYLIYFNDLLSSENSAPLPCQGLRLGADYYWKFSFPFGLLRSFVLTSFKIALHLDITGTATSRSPRTREIGFGSNFTFS